MVVHRLFGRNKAKQPPSEPGSASGKVCGVESDGSGANHHRIKLGEFGTPPVTQSIPSRSRDMLRRAGSWFLNYNILSPQGHHNHPGNTCEKYGSFPEIHGVPSTPSRTNYSVKVKCILTWCKLLVSPLCVLDKAVQERVVSVRGEHATYYLHTDFVKRPLPFIRILPVNPFDPWPVEAALFLGSARIFGLILSFTLPWENVAEAQR